jgi:hypothetical protein
LLLESIQSLKYYLVDICIEFEFDATVDFDGFFDKELGIKDETYHTKLIVTNFSLSINQNYTTDESGDIVVGIPAQSLQLIPDNLDLIFLNGTDSTMVFIVEDMFNLLK